MYLCVHKLKSCCVGNEFISRQARLEPLSMCLCLFDHLVVLPHVPILLRELPLVLACTISNHTKRQQHTRANMYDQRANMAVARVRAATHSTITDQEPDAARHL